MEREAGIDGTDHGWGKQFQCRQKIEKMIRLLIPRPSGVSLVGNIGFLASIPDGAGCWLILQLYIREILQ